MSNDINPIFHRVALLTGEDRLEKIKQTNVLVFGAGGVGSWCAEALVRSGIGKIGIVDFDTVCESNINRQAEATVNTLGRVKVDVLKQRLLEINPECEVTAVNKLFCGEDSSSFNINKADYVIDAIDSINHKIDLIEITCNANVTLYSSMGMALKMDPSQIKTASIWDTRVCPLARLVRQELRKHGFSSNFTVVYSSETPIRAQTAYAASTGEKTPNGSIVTVTASAGFLLASLVLRDITGL